MKSLHIRDLDEATLDGLKKRAARHRRSLQKEVQWLLEQAALMIPDIQEENEAPKLSLHTIQSNGQKTNRWDRESIYQDNGR